MTIATFSDLKTQVQSYFNDRSDIPDVVYDLATAELNARLNLRIMETETTLSLADDGESEDLPSDFLRVVHAYIDTGGTRYPLDAADEFSRNADYCPSGIPTTYSVIDGKMLFNPIPDGAYTVTLRYIAKLDDFSADADTNDVLTTHPALFLYASLKHCAFWAQDQEALQFYGVALESELKRVQRADDLARFGTGPLKVRTRHVR